MDILELKEIMTAYKEANPTARTYDIASELGVSEMEILEASEVQSRIYLGANYKAILSDLAALGKVMALTRNEHAVSETKGIYDKVSFMDKAPMGIAHNEIIDMRYFLSTWAHVYAVVFGSGNRIMHSLQFFDKYGRAVHKVYTTKDSDLIAYEALVQKYTTEEGRTVNVEAPKDVTPVSKDTTDLDIDLGAFQTEWLNMKDTHDFFGMLHKYGLSRQQAFRLAPEGTTYQVGKESIVQMLEQVAEQETPIMVFLGNGACLQIFTGEIKKTLPLNNWYNVMDKDFNLHLKLDSIEEVWVVKNYTADGIVTSLELFDKDNMHILYCFGKRKPGIPELEEWRNTINLIPKLN